MNTRGKIIIGNWKLNGSKQLMEQTLQVLGQTIDLADSKKNLSLAISAPAIYAGEMIRLAGETSDRLLIGCKNINTDPHMFTGELTAQTAKKLGCKLCLVGHAERHSPLNEGDYSYRLKVEQLLEAGIAPVLCIGDSEEQNSAEKSSTVMFQQLSYALANLSGKLTGSRPLYIAYEPAYNTSQQKPLTSIFAQNVHAEIRKMLEEILGKDCAQNIPIIYGGSINLDNALDLINQPDVDGLLVSCANSNLQHFRAICNRVITFSPVFNYVTEHKDSDNRYAAC